MGTADNKKIVDDFAKWGRRGTAAFVVLFITVVIGLVEVVHQNEEIEQTAKTAKIAASRTSELAKKSAIARVTTVSERCELTQHIVVVLKNANNKETIWFEESLTACREQLAEVQEIANQFRQ